MFQFLVRKISENKKEKDNGSYFVVQCLLYSSNIEFLKIMLLLTSSLLWSFILRNEKNEKALIILRQVSGTSWNHFAMCVKFLVTIASVLQFLTSYQLRVGQQAINKSALRRENFVHLPQLRNFVATSYFVCREVTSWLRGSFAWWFVAYFVAHLQVIILLLNYF